MKRVKRDHFGYCMVHVHQTDRRMSGGPYPTMEGAIEAHDPFNGAVYWPLRNVIPYLGRIGL